MKYQIVNTRENIVVPKKEYPFYKEIKRLIKENPEYQKKIEDGFVHLACDPGHGFNEKEAAHETTP